MRQQILRYWLAMNASAFDSASAASITFVVASGGHELAPGIAPFDFKQLGLIFLAAFISGLRAYLKANPIAQAIPALKLDTLEKVNAELAAAKGTQEPRHVVD